MNKKGASNTGLLIFLVALIAVAVVGGVGFAIWKFSGVAQTTITTPEGVTTPVTLSGGCGQNPSVTYAFTNALTKQGITAGPYNFLDKTTGGLLGTSTSSFAQGQVVIPVVNATGYIRAKQPEYTTICGNQQMKGSLYQYSNVTIELSSSTGTGTVGAVGGINATIGNDTKFTTQKNLQVKLTGNTYRSTSRLFIVYELSNVTSVQSAALSDGSSIIPSVPVPGCYSPNRAGNSFKIAWEVPAIIGGNIKTYNLQTTSLNGNSVSGDVYLYTYAEQDTVDSLNGQLLESGICDSNNANTWLDLQKNLWQLA